MATKRSASQSTPSKEEPPQKKPFVATPPVNIGSVATEEELDLKVLKFQNAKLCSKLEEKNSLLNELSAKISELDRLRANDQTIISTLNVAWNQLDKDVAIMLERFTSVGDDDNSCCMSDSTVAFLERLHNRTTKGIEEEIGKRNAQNWSKKEKEDKRDNKSISTLDQNEHQEPMTEGKEKNEDESKTNHEDEAGFAIASIEVAIKQENSELKGENERLHTLVTSLHDRYNDMSSEFSDIHDKYSTAQKEIGDLNTKAQDMQYDLQKSQHQVEKLINRVNEVTSEKGGGLTSTSATLLSNSSSSSKTSAQPTSTSNQQVDDLKFEIEEQKEIAKGRLEELDNLQKSHTKIIKEYERLKLESAEISDENIINSAAYKTLQNHFTLLFAEAQQIRNQAEDSRKIISANRAQHLQQMEQIEAEALVTKRKVRYEVSQLEKLLMESRRELELLKVEYEHNMKAHEQIGPMAKEMRHLINSLQNHNQQLKGEVMRYKRKLVETQNKFNELDARLKGYQEREKNTTQTVEKPEPEKEESSYIQVTDSVKPNQQEAIVAGEDLERTPSPPLKVEPQENDIVKELKTKLKHAKESQKEMKLLLDMYKEVAKESREKSELLQSEKQLKEEIAVLNQKIDNMSKEFQKKGIRSEDDLLRRLKHAEETIMQLQKRIANTKQEEEALLAEMEFTGQAFEEMQEQNIRLMQQLREKDDSNLKLMSERIKANQVQKLLKEEKEVLVDQINTLNARHQTVEEVIRRLEEREKTLQAAAQNMEKEINLRSQACELHKRKAIEVTQQVAEYTFKADTASKQLNEAKDMNNEKNNQLEEEAFKCRRALEENASLQRKVEKLKRAEYLGYSDEILVEEVKMYKAKLNCPCCNTRRKDAILTKCFHVFCMECLKTRYDTRQRKCPKCNATFGNNDFRKIYM
eukprot:gene13718-15148_t